MDSETEPCSFCSIIAGRKFSPTIAPVCMEGECCSLSKQCLCQIARTQSLLHPDHLRNLPIPLLEELKFHLTDAPLFTLSDLFRENGIDTRPAWEVLLYRRFGYKYLALCQDWIAPWYTIPMFRVGKRSPHPCQIYMSKLCQVLTESAMDTYTRNKGGIKEKICDSCLTRFSAYVSGLKYLSVSWKQFCWIIDADTCVSEILKSTLKCLVDLDLCNIPDNVDSNDINFVKQLLAGNKLKSLSLGAVYPRRDYHRLFVSLFSADKTTDNDKQPVNVGETSDESDKDKSVKAESKGETGEKEIDLFDEALQSNMPTDGDQATASLAALSEIRERIQALEQNQGDFNEEKGYLESLSVQMMDFSVDFIQLLQAYKTIKRLEYRCISQDKQGWSEVCAMVGSRRLTHLSVKADSPMFSLLMATLFENYRSGDGISQPMESLSFCDIGSMIDPNYGAGLQDYHYPITALRQLELIDTWLSDSMVAKLILFLRYNTVLTHLHIDCITAETRLNVSTILSAVSKHRTLESLTLCLDDLIVVRMRTAADEEAVVSLLRTNPQLKHLVLKGCNVSRHFVSSEAFLSAVKNHSRLEHLSLGNNKLGTAGVDLLLALNESQAAPSLKALVLDKCEIPGKQLLAAARVISERHSGRLFLHHLSLCHNRTNLPQLLELQTCFSSCVRLPHIEGHTTGRRGTSDLAGFDEEEVDDSDSDSD